MAPVRVTIHIYFTVIFYSVQRLRPLLSLRKHPITFAVLACKQEKKRGAKCLQAAGGRAGENVTCKQVIRWSHQAALRSEIEKVKGEGTADAAALMRQAQKKVKEALVFLSCRNLLRCKNGAEKYFCSIQFCYAQCSSHQLHLLPP